MPCVPIADIGPRATRLDLDLDFAATVTPELN